MAEPQDVGSPRGWEDECGGPSRFTARFLVGFALLGLGALWTLDNLGLLDASQITRWWPVLLVVFGGAKVLGWGARRSAFSGGMWMLAGAWLLLHSLGFVHVGIAGLGSLALIIIGVRFIIHPRRERTVRVLRRGFAQGSEQGGRIKMDVVMSNAHRRFDSGTFRGGQIASVLASAELDLRRATLESGRAELEINAVMASAEVFVPRDWRVESAMTSVLGNVEDHTDPIPEGAAVRGTLLLTGAVVMGGVEIRN